MTITPVIPDIYDGPIKQLMCRICKYVFYLTLADYEQFTEVTYCHECSIILREELEKHQVAQSKLPPQQTPTPASPREQALTPVFSSPVPTSVSAPPSIHVPIPRTIDRDQMTVEQLLEEAKMIEKTCRYEEALTSYEQALQHDSRCLAALYGKGKMLRQVERPQEALTVYADTLHLDPAQVKAYIGKGWTLLPLKRYEEALADFDYTLELDPSVSGLQRGKDIMPNCYT